ncbi:MAG: (4Fe-4S)-binding protein [Candidatus Omnitrophota bacterium]|nr:MAG: (4Fe-4S)-binding protein [Candidatus Omnitrophota bacterium]
MKQIVVISGKGGTGKTVFTASLAVLAESKVLADCDVDAADLHLILKPVIVQTDNFVGGKAFEINRDICIKCGKCIQFCRFKAISADFIIDPIFCEGCGLCKRICPVNAISESDRICGQSYISNSKYGPFAHAKLDIAEGNSGKLVSKVRQAAKKIALQKKLDYVIIDGTPGIGCALIASIAGVDLAVVVVEPTISGIHDMQRVLDVAAHFKVVSKVVINKFDINLENCAEIEEVCKIKGVEIIGRIPFSRQVSESIVKCIPMVEYVDMPIREKIIAIWEKIKIYTQM